MHTVCLVKACLTIALLLILEPGYLRSYTDNDINQEIHSLSKSPPVLHDSYEEDHEENDVSDDVDREHEQTRHPLECVRLQEPERLDTQVQTRVKVPGTAPAIQKSLLIRNMLIGNFQLLGTDFHSSIFTKNLVQYTFIRNSG